ncbi:hypothetical protein DFJ77DRAFT_551954 [Powellomyces hirtus]|nr:hypothetical protein DFJ77DRAFT_551954 [Powellomyces hirtus]
MIFARSWFRPLLLLIYKLFRWIRPLFTEKAHSTTLSRQQPLPKKPKLLESFSHTRRGIQKAIYEWAALSTKNSVVTRQLQSTCVALHAFDSATPLNDVSLILPSRTTVFTCYGCNRPCKKTHPVYVFSCMRCGTRFQQYRHLTRNLSGHVAVVVGARTKLGHQVVIKLLQAGATVIGTWRFPEKALQLFEQYPFWDQWKELLTFYPWSLALDTSDIATLTKSFGLWIPEGKIDILVICAAQTIRAHSRFVPNESINSWQMQLPDLVQSLMEEVYRINAVAPILLIQQLTAYLQNSHTHPYIINAHAREGLFTVANHIYTNMAKAGLAMLTKCLKGAKLKTHNGNSFWIHGCDLGWISVDEYFEDNRPWKVPPLDEVDGAARVLYPVQKVERILDQDAATF